MILHVKEVRYLHDYVIWLRFSDEAAGEVDLADELDGEVFEPLRKKSLFRALRVDPVLRTVVWPNGADVAPEFLYEKMTPAAYPECDRKGSHEALAAREKRSRYATQQQRKRRKP